MCVSWNGTIHMTEIVARCKHCGSFHHVWKPLFLKFDQRTKPGFACHIKQPTNYHFQHSQLRFISSIMLLFVFTSCCLFVLSTVFSSVCTGMYIHIFVQFDGHHSPSYVLSRLLRQWKTATVDSKLHCSQSDSSYRRHPPLHG